MSESFYVTLTSGAQTILSQIPLPRGEHMENECGHVADRLHQVTSFHSSTLSQLSNGQRLNQ